MPSTTSGAAMRELREAGLPFVLPSSGWEVRLRPIAMDAILEMEEMPADLVPVVQELFFDEQALQQDKKRSPDELTAVFKIQRVVVKHALVHPRVVSEPEDDDEISIDDLDLEDRGYVFNCVIQPTRSFRRLSEASQEPVPAVDVPPGDGDEAI